MERGRRIATPQAIHHASTLNIKRSVTLKVTQHSGPIKSSTNKVGFLWANVWALTLASLQRIGVGDPQVWAEQLSPHLQTMPTDGIKKRAQRIREIAPGWHELGINL